MSMAQLPVIGGGLSKPDRTFEVIGAIVGIWVIWEIFKRAKKTVGF
jgi:hypothetical protein